MTEIAYDAMAIAERVMRNPARNAMALSAEETVVLAVAVKHPGVVVSRDEDGLVFIIPAEAPADETATTQEENDHDR